MKRENTWSLVLHYGMSGNEKTIKLWG